MIPKSLHQIWIGPDPIPQDLERLMTRLQTGHPDWRYTLWKDDNLPQMPQHAQQVYDHFYNKGEYAFASDILRYYILATYGGVYMDCDFELTGKLSLNDLPLDKNLILVNQRKHGPSGNFKYRFQNCFLATAPNGAFAQRILNSIGRIQYTLTNLKRVPCEKYSCQYITTEYLMHIEHSVATKTVHVIQKDLSQIIPKDEAILEHEYFFGRNALIAKHLYANSHKKPRRKQLMNRQQLIAHLNLSGLGIEIGVQKGKFAEVILKNSNLHLILLDAWRYIDGYIDRANCPTAVHTKHITRTIERLVKHSEGRFTIMRELSEVAVDFFKDQAFDFIYLDANHSEQFVYNQLVQWWPKLKPGGWIAGHDYIDKITAANHFGTKTAVDRFFAEKELSVSSTVEPSFPTWYIQKR